MMSCSSKGIAMAHTGWIGLASNHRDGNDTHDLMQKCTMRCTQFYTTKMFRLSQVLPVPLNWVSPVYHNKLVAILIHCATI